MQILNLEALSTVTRRLQWKGQVHDVTELNVEQFINGIKESNERQAADKAAGRELNQAEQMERMFQDSLTAIGNAIPTFPKEDLPKLTLEQCNVLLNFIRGELEVDAAGLVKKAPAADGAEGADGKKQD